MDTTIVFISLLSILDLAGRDGVEMQRTLPQVFYCGFRSTHGALEFPTRLPKPDIQDMEMPDYPVDNSESFAEGGYER